MPNTFTQAFTIEGWDDYSLWGYDSHMGTYFAQLWRNTDDRDANPTVWVGVLDPITTTSALAEEVAARIGMPVDVVAAGMPLPPPSA